MGTLKDTQIKALKPKEKTYRVADGEGLAIAVNPTGSKKWQYRYRIEGISKSTGEWKTLGKIYTIGSYPEISLSEAREKLKELRKKVNAGIDPIEDDRNDKKEKEIEASKKINTFKKVGDEWLEDLAKRVDKGLRSESHRKRSEGLLKNYAYPYFGSVSITELTENDVKQPLIALDNADKKESVRKLFGVLRQVFIFAKGRTYCTSNPLKYFEVSEVIGDFENKSYPTLTKDTEIENLLNSIDLYTGSISVRLGLKFMALTALRSINIRKARWEQIDLDNKIMTIHRDEMKNKATMKKHNIESFMVPLSDQAVRVLEEIYPFTGSGKYIFPSTRGDRPLSDVAMLACIRSLGYTKDQFTPHGFRAMFSTIANDKTDFGFEVIESQLSHTVGSEVSQSYNRTQYFDKRVPLMEWWGNYLEGLQQEKEEYPLEFIDAEPDDEIYTDAGITAVTFKKPVKE